MQVDQSVGNAYYLSRTPSDSPRLPAQHGLRRSPGLTDWQSWALTRATTMSGTPPRAPTPDPDVGEDKRGLQRKPRCAGSRGLSGGARTLDRATAPKRETATSPPVSSIATSLLDLSPRVRGCHTDNSAVQRELGESRRKSHITLRVTRSTMKIITLSLSSLSLSFGYATC